MKHFKRVIINDVYYEYADMMNRDKPIELVRDNYKLSVKKHLQSIKINMDQIKKKQKNIYI